MENFTLYRRKLDEKILGFYASGLNQIVENSAREIFIHYQRYQY